MAIPVIHAVRANATDFIAPEVPCRCFRRDDNGGGSPVLVICSHLAPVRDCRKARDCWKAYDDAAGSGAVGAAGMTPIRQRRRYSLGAIPAHCLKARVKLAGSL